MGKETTKKMIVIAFRELMSEKSLNKITINDIAQKCSINRQTFYYHFHDIIDLIDWICETEGEKAMEVMAHSSWKEAFLGLFGLIQKDKVLVTNIYKHTSAEYLNKILYRVTYQLWYNIISEQAGDIPIQETDKEFLAHFFKFGFIGMITEWIDQGMKEDPKQIVEKLEGLIEGSIRNVLLKYSEAEKETSSV